MEFAVNMHFGFVTAWFLHPRKVVSPSQARALPWLSTVLVTGACSVGVTAAAPTSSYELIRIEIIKSFVGEQPQPTAYEEVIADNFSESAVTLQVAQPTYTATISFTAKPPPRIASAGTEFSVTPKVDCSWNLANPVDNLNAGVGVLGGGEQKALPESGGGTLQAGGHSLSAEFTATGSFQTFEFEREWVENDVEYRSFTATFHCGVGQGLSGGTVVYVYQAID